MRLKPGVDYVAFLKQVRVCGGEVNFKTADGDVLNLKSLLSEYVFLTLATTDSPKRLVENGYIECASDNDYALLAEHLKEND
jgi:hypothetical protein